RPAAQQPAHLTLSPPLLSSPDHFRRPSPLPHLAHQLILDRWLRPFRLQESESCTPSEKTYTRSLPCQQLQTSIPLSFLSKTLERAVLGQLSCYLSQNDLLDPNQSGFKTGHSTETTLLCVTEAFRTAKANSLSSALILLDLSAAFDTVNHQILLSTLSELGISGAAHAWIASYLTGRSYQVAWRESVSAPRALTTGVPQGSVLGPLLFSLYTKSLGSVISSHGLSYHCYADDTQLIFSFPPSDNQAANRISACLADISVWMTDHHLKLNLGKTELLFLQGKDCPVHDLAITVDNSLVSSSQSAKNLGVILDNTLSFSTNIKAVTRSCRFMLYNIRRVRPCLTQEAT
uniref:Reverse transcriptase domain-containing protein n=1 Tax=Salmo trutta TaxID=8032 RepID=A0A674DE50_SALTR